MKKITALSLLLSLNVSAFAGVQIDSVVKTRAEGEKNDHYICLGEGWDKTNVLVHSKIKDLKTVFPELFKDLSEKEKNCFAPAEVPYSAQKTIDDILKRIEAGAADKFHVSVQEDGSLIPTREVKSASVALGLDEDCPESKSSLEKLNLKVEEEFKLRNQNKTFGRKMLRAELLVGGVEAAGMGILISLPKSITKWDEDWMDDAKRNLKRAWTEKPVWDKDDWAINYIGHPLSGAIYYNALRSQGATRMQSFLFSTVQSTIWEYGVEAIAERPSIQDLIVTPVVGSVIGELAHQATLRMARKGFTFGEKVLVTVINPTYVMNNGYKGKK